MTVDCPQTLNVLVPRSALASTGSERAATLGSSDLLLVTLSATCSRLRVNHRARARREGMYRDRLSCWIVRRPARHHEAPSCSILFLQHEHIGTT